MSFPLGNRHKGARSAVPRTAAKQGVFAALDIGSSKVACFIGKAEQGRSGVPLPVRVIGIGHQPSHGLRGGAVVDMALTEHAIRAAVESAERMAEQTVRHVTINLSSGRPVSRIVNADVDLNGCEVSDDDLRHLIDVGQSQYNCGEQTLVHGVPVCYSIDHNGGIRDPRGMCGDNLGLNMHMVSATSGPIRNLMSCVQRCHLDVDHVVIAPYSSGLACLVEDELDLGVTCIDMGGGTTSVAVFSQSALQFAGIVPIGGNHVTADLARGLTTSLQNAERMKTLYGSALGGPNDGREMIRVPQVGEDDGDEGMSVPRNLLNGIIRPRLEETFEMLRDQLEKSGYGGSRGHRIVLTGGASQMNGVKDFAAQMLGKQVRLGQPIKLTGLAEATRGPAFSGCAGLLSYAASPPPYAFGLGDNARPAPSGNGISGGLEKIRNWLR